jgi:hypothetical protein
MDAEGQAEELAQLRATRRRIIRMRTAEQRYGRHEHRADTDAKQRANTIPHEQLPDQSPDTLIRLQTEQAMVEFDRASLFDDRTADDIPADTVDL